MYKIAVWKPLEYEGLEHLVLREDDNGIWAKSVVISAEKFSVFRLNYDLFLDRNYGVHAIRIGVDDELPIELLSDLRGNWTDEEGLAIPRLSGCIDVDISATPFTNTLPIRRLQWQIGQVETLRMVYIHVPDLTVSVMRQRYTCLEKSEQGGLFRYENVDSEYTALLTVDADGLVVHYPGLFERLV